MNFALKMLRMARPCPSGWGLVLLVVAFSHLSPAPVAEGYHLLSEFSPLPKISNLTLDVHDFSCGVQAGFGCRDGAPFLRVRERQASAHLA